MKHRRWAAAVVTVALTSAGGCVAARSSADPGAAPTSPLDGRRFHVDPQGSAPRLARQWLRDGDPRARALDPLARRATGIWLVGQPDTRARLGGIARQAAARGEVPVVVVYALPHRDCGSHSAGGLPGRAAYLAYVRTVVDALADVEAVVVLEPDAVPQLLDGCLAPQEAQDRLQLLSEAVTLLAGRKRHVYLDAGHSGWIGDVDRLAGALRRAGVERARGFALNVSNFRRTEEVVAYGGRLSQRLGGLGYVVDTSRNGTGPATSVPTGPAWCNPRGRRVGAAPTGRTGLPNVHAFLWVKVPGDSDGSCRPGEPAAGTFWPEYALDLVD